MIPIIDNVLGIIDKVIPDADSKAKLTMEIAKLDINDFKQKKGIITRILHLVFPFFALALLVMYCVEFWLRVTQYLEVGDWITISIVPSGIELIVVIFLSLLMPKKIIESILPILTNYLQDKIKRK